MSVVKVSKNFHEGRNNSVFCKIVNYFVKTIVCYEALRLNLSFSRNEKEAVVCELWQGGRVLLLLEHLLL